MDAKLNIGHLRKIKKDLLDASEGEGKQARRIAALTAYDATFARIIDEAGADVIVIGDSLGMVIHGERNTTAVTMDDMVYHSSCVCAHVKRAITVGDMPFMSCVTVDLALRNAARLIQEGGVEMVKIETNERSEEIVDALSGNGISSCAHLGLKPQSVHKIGGHRRYEAAAEAVAKLISESKKLEAAGADMLLLECVPAWVAKKISENSQAPVIGIGSGPDCDGQILVSYDVIGLTERRPSFARNFLNERNSIREAFSQYVEEASSGRFPGEKESPS